MPHFHQKQESFYDLGLVGADGNITSGDGHIIVNYDEVINKGLVWFENRVLDKLNSLDLTNVMI